MTELTKPDLLTIGLDRLPSFWDDKPKATGLLKSFLQAFQNPLDLIFEILNETPLADAEGVQLDIIGRLWAVLRETRSDADYRIAIFQAITNATVDSTPERIYEVMKVASNATQLELTEYSPNIYLYLNISVIETLKELAKTTTAAGVDINLVFPPYEDNKTPEAIETAFDYSFPFLFKTDPSYWVKFNCSMSNVASSLRNDIDDVLLTDASTITTSYVVPQITDGRLLSPTDLYSFSVFVKKSGIDPIIRFVPRLAGDFNTSSFDMHVDPITGNYLVNNVVNITAYESSVRDLGNYFFVQVEFICQEGTSSTDADCLVYPCYGTVLGTADQSVTGSNTIAQLYLTDKWDTYYYFSIQEDNTGLRTSELLLDTYNLIDNVGDFIIDNVSDFIEVESGFIYENNALPLGEVSNIKLSQPCTEVI